MDPLCLALLAGCMARPIDVMPPIAPRPTYFLLGRSLPPAELAPDDPRIAPAPKQYFDPAPDRVWAKVTSKRYSCPGTPRYGQGSGVYLTEADATMSGFHPIGGRACFRGDGTRPQRRSPN